MSGHFRLTTWDPVLLISQIISVQTAYYSTLLLILALGNLIVSDENSIEHVFNHSEVHVRDITGRVVVASFLINSLLGAAELWLVVGRTKLCLDFSATCQILHLLLCGFYTKSIPSTVSWWLLHIACLTIMCVTGEFLCLRTEMKAIPLSAPSRVDL